MKSLDIVGGVYREFVVIPEHIDLLGSAGRAAVAIGPRRASITLHTALSAADRTDFDRLEKSNAFRTRVVESVQSVTFSYMHGLDPPRIFPAPHTIHKKPALEVTAPRVLCYGALDMNWRITANQAVYDPQDAFGAKPFKNSGSSVKRLGIVLNEYEARHITGKGNIDSMIRELFRIDNPEVVVLKCGAKGTVVATSKENRATIPPLITPNVFKIGSGDVFSAFFAWAWMIKAFTPLQSAKLASQATAYYVSTRTLPIPRTFISDNKEYGTRFARLPPKNNQRVYLASPFFTITQRWLVEEARLYLGEGGLNVFSPVHDIGHGPASKVVKADIAAIRQCDVVYAIVSGLDAGTMFEIGYARAINKPVIVYVENEKSEDLKMLDGSGCILTNDFATSIYTTIWAARFPK